jgi:hypothetical protein
VETSIPHIRKFMDDHKDQKDKLAFLLVHDSLTEQCYTHDEMVPKLRAWYKNLVGKIKGYDWIMQEKPFSEPILFVSHDAVAPWGIHGYPTVIALNPEGKIYAVYCGAREDHMQALDKVLTDGLKAMK